MPVVRFAEQKFKFFTHAIELVKSLMKDLTVNQKEVTKTVLPGFMILRSFYFFYLNINYKHKKKP